MEHIYEVIKCAALKNPDNTALIHKDEDLTFRALLDNAQQIADFLENQLHVGLCVGNARNYYISYVAILQSGGAVVPISPNENPETIAEILNVTGASVLITDREDLINSNGLDNVSILDLFTMRIKKGFGDLRKQDQNNVAVLLRTSGSTGNSKVVYHKHASLLWVARAHNERIGAKPDQRALIILPLWTSFVHTTQFLAQLIIGATTIVLDTPYLPQDVYNYISKYNVDTMGCVPTNLKLFNNIKPNPSQVKLLKLMIIAGASINSSDLLEAKRIFTETKLLKAYGLTEAGPRVTCQRPFEELNDGVGTPLSGISIQIIDEIGKSLLPSEVGEICVKGPGLMEGYFNNHQATNEVFLEDGWLKTGDLGTLDDLGQLYILGRKKNVIIVGGNTVYPEELEEFIFSFNDNIKEVLITGEIDSLLGERISLSIVLINQDLEEETLKSLRTSLYEKLPNYKRPKNIEVLSCLPKTENGKIDRKMKVRLE
ncbi:class I adenylate-forming enzyme family protein [Paenibacillus sp. FSL R5-0473]|uniref:class I adenylate-forming enzyme family protein n=1 Tax=Paenibacillus sp. FSL R5-0473 TaxID=2921642 RepID=UPI0030FB6DA6